MSGTVYQRNKRTRAEQHLLTRTLMVGVALTIAVCVLDQSGRLARVENYFYDERVKHCQFFHPIPSDKIVHVDIDDGSIETNGRFPWKRSLLADVVDELSRAHAKATAFDIVLSEPQEPSRDESGAPTDHDKILGDAIRNAGNVLMPTSLALEKPPEETQSVQAAVPWLILQLDLSRTELNHRLFVKSVPPLSPDDFVRALKSAMLKRVRAELAGQPLQQIETASLVNRLLPNRAQMGANPPEVKYLQQVILQVEAEESQNAFSLPLPPNLNALHAYGALAPIPEFAMAARYGGLVDHIAEGDGTVRSIPLAVEYQNRLFPQMGLVLACAQLGVDPKSIVFEPTRVRIPLPDGSTTEIAVTSKQTHLGRFGMFMEVPWIGSVDWTKMYGTAGKQHINIGLLTDLADERRRLRQNNSQIDAQLHTLLPISLALAPAANEFEKLKGKLDTSSDDFDLRKPIVDAVLSDKELAESIHALQSQNDLSQDEKFAVGAYAGIALAREQSIRLQATIKDASSLIESAVRDKTVLVGSTATSMTDFVNTPITAQVPGVVVHGVVVNGILTRLLWKDAPAWVTIFYTITAGLLATIAVTYLRTWKAAVACAVLLGGFLILNGVVLFDQANYLIGTAGPVVAITLVWTATNLITVIVEYAERIKITNRFSDRVDPQLVDFVLEFPDHIRLEGQLKELTVCFTDLQGFTAVSEKLGEKTVEVLKGYMERMVPIIRARHGYLNKFLGDGIMFVFGCPYDNPNHAIDAVETVIEMQKATRAFSDEMVARGLPPVWMRVGVATGPMVVGDVASDYTVLGDVVNTCARLEKANKRFGSSILMNYGTFSRLNGEEFLTRPVGSLMLAGKSESVDAFEVLCKTDDATEAQTDVAKLSTQIVNRFNSKDEQGALKVIEDLVARHGPSKFAATYEHLCLHVPDEEETQNARAVVI